MLNLKSYIRTFAIRRQFVNNEDFLQKKAKELSKKVFTGGSLKDFEISGRLQLIGMLRVGLYPHSKVLDVGCGCLRGGYWLIHFLNPHCYAGVEPNKEMLDAGISNLLDPDTVELKKPRFDYNSDFDFSVFNEKFDFFLARSIWTHASKNQIQQMLDSFIENSKDSSVFFSTYAPTRLLRSDYKGKTWIGKSHESSKAGVIFHSYSWIKEQCNQRSLKVKELGFDLYNTPWLYITKEL